VHFTQAIVKVPGSNFATGITSVIGGDPPDLKLALVQHERYCDELRNCGLKVVILPADLHHPDSTFIEDTAILIPGAAIVTRPGARSRQAEVVATRESLRAFFDVIHEIQAPGSVDGGDICEVDGDFVIGLSARTNEEGARQLTGFLHDHGHKSLVVDIRASATLLHLKTGLSYLGDGVFVIAADAPFANELRRYELVAVGKAEAYAANCIRVNERLLMPAGFPQVRDTLAARGLAVQPLQMSEFKKMDGGLSCLSLRF
jgi:dimethylargininase